MRSIDQLKIDRSHKATMDIVYKERYTSVYLTLDALCRKAIVSGLSKTQDPVLMQAMLLTPVIQLFDMYEGLEHQFDPEQYTECVRLSVDSVLL